MSLFSLPEQCSVRSIVVPLALVLAAMFCVKVFKISLYPNPLMDFVLVWYVDRYWTPATFGPSGQGQGLRIFMLKFCIKVFRNKLFPNHGVDFLQI